MAFRFKWLAVINREFAKCTSSTLLDGISLACQTTTTHIDKHVVLGAEPQGLKRCFDSSQVGGVLIQIVVARTSVDGDRAIARNQANASDRGLTAPCAPINDGVV